MSISSLPLSAFHLSVFSSILLSCLKTPIIIIITSNNHRLESAGLNALEELLKDVENAQRRL